MSSEPSSIPNLTRGGALRRALRSLARLVGLDRLMRKRHPFDNTAFTSAFVSLAAKMATADGVAVHAEQTAFEQFLEIEPSHIEGVRRVFNLAKEDPSGFETYAERISTELAGEPDLKRQVLECLIYIACSDGVLHPAEDAFLHTVAERFGLAEAQWRQMRAQFVHDPGSPYEVMGLPHGAGAAEVKARYRELVSRTHPDRLTAEGAPPAVIKAANAKLAALNAAYDAIMAGKAHAKRAP